MLALLLALTVTTSPQARPAVTTVCPAIEDRGDAQHRMTAEQGQDPQVCCDGCEAMPANDSTNRLEEGSASKPTTKNAPKSAPPVFKTYMD